AKTFEQSIGFLRIVDGEEPLDNTAIHPESYDVAYRMLHQLDLTAQDIGSVKLKNTLSNVNISTLVSQLNIGEPTLKDIIQSLIAPN
ncbi:RNA-binding transcriptional accessory protein, partial [Mycobacterium tuberculosis]|nr:RNA-binding transcriptional accessory protein [Mycobacterium tuberculosis]